MCNLKKYFMEAKRGNDMMQLKFSITALAFDLSIKLILVALLVVDFLN